jgi:hypothetical protein
LATIQTPTPGANTVIGDTNIQFTWNAGTPASTGFQLWLGTTPSASNIFKGATKSLAITVPVPDIPGNGAIIYATLWQEQSGAWKSTSYKYTEYGSPTPATITTPANGATLGTANVQFAWPGAAGPVDYTLLLGTGGYGTSDIYKGNTSASSITVPSIPNNGVDVYAEFEQEISGKWQVSDYQYTESGTEVPGAITSPVPGSVLGASSQQFQWTLGTGVTDYELRVGLYSGVCSYDLYSSPVLNPMTSSITATYNPASLPSSGSDVYVCLIQRINDSWSQTEYTYIAP